MKMVIDINEEEYKRIIKGNWIGNPMAEIIEDGAPHPCPCDLCRYDPPSSTDGKPCSECVAEGVD